jgi:transcriptional regulator with XRE-family HTH domain
MTRLEYHRRKLGLTLEQVGKIIGCSKDTWAVYEHPRNRKRKIKKDIKEAIEQWTGHNWKYLRSKCQ